MHERRWDIVLQLDDVESQCRNGQNLGAVNRPVPLKFPCWCHAEFVGEMPPLVVVLMRAEDDKLYGFCSAIERPERPASKAELTMACVCGRQVIVLLASLCWCLLSATVLELYWL